MKKSICVALLLSCIGLLLCGCSSEQDKLVGRWETSVELTSLLNEEISNSSDLMKEYVEPGEYKVTFLWTFYQDGTYSMLPESGSLEKAEREFYNSVRKGMETYLQEELEKISPELSREEYLAGLGLTMDSFMLQLLGDNPISAFLQDLELKKRGCYVLEDGKLYLSESINRDPGKDHLLYELHEDTLILELGKWEDSLGRELFPAILRRDE